MSVSASGNLFCEENYLSYKLSVTVESGQLARTQRASISGCSDIGKVPTATFSGVCLPCHVYNEHTNMFQQGMKKKQQLGALSM